MNDLTCHTNTLIVLNPAPSRADAFSEWTS